MLVRFLFFLQITTIMITRMAMVATAVIVTTSCTENDRVDSQAIMNLIATNSAIDTMFKVVFLAADQLICTILLQATAKRIAPRSIWLHE